MTNTQETSVIRIMNSKVAHLRAIDEAVWPVNSVRIVQIPFLPEASFEPVNNTHGSIFYRGVYYYSTDPARPYVRLLKNRNLTLPIVSSCIRHSYDNFLKEFLEGGFGDHAITVHTPDHHVLTHK